MRKTLEEGLGGGNQDLGVGCSLTWAQAAGQSGARALGSHGLAGGPSLVPQV